MLLLTAIISFYIGAIFSGLIMMLLSGRAYKKGREDEREFWIIRMEELKNINNDGDE